MTCQRDGCENPIQQNRGGARRKWCSDRCRKLASYAKPCIDCGGPTGMSGTAQSSERCCECSHRHEHESRRWTREAMIGAIQAWADNRGGVPPVATDWNVAVAAQKGRIKPPRGHEYPATSMVQREFGSWNAAVEAAGFDPFERGRYGRESEYIDTAEILALYVDQQLSAYEVGRRLGMSGDGVRYRLRKAGVTIRQWNRWDYERAA